MYGRRKGIFAKGFVFERTRYARAAASAFVRCSEVDDENVVVIEPTVTIEGDIMFNWPWKT